MFGRFRQEFRVWKNKVRIPVLGRKGKILKFERLRPKIEFNFYKDKVRIAMFGRIRSELEWFGRIGTKFQCLEG